MKHDGFTLIEIMLSTAILAVVVVIAYGVFARTLSAKEYTEARAAETATARALLTRMTRDLQGLVLRSSSPLPQPTPSARDRDRALPKATQQILFVSRNHNESGVPFDDLSFSAMLRRPTTLLMSTTDLAVVRYFVERDPANPSRHVLFRESILSLSGDVYDPEQPTAASTVRLLDGLAGIEFRFFDGREWVQEWDSGDARNFGPAPQAVEIALAIYSERGDPEVFRTAVDLPLARVSSGPPNAAHAGGGAGGLGAPPGLPPPAGGLP